jgi:hypothetical protein
MASPNSNYTDLIVTTLEFLGEEMVDAVTSNNAATAWLKANDGWGTIEGGEKIVEPLAYAENSNAQWYSGGEKIVEPLAYAENSNAAWYSGGERLPINPQEEFSGSEYAWKQLAVAIVNTGLETDVQNVGGKRRFDLVKERIKNARRTMANLVAVGFFSDGTGFGGKQLTGVKAALSATPTTGIYGGINRATTPQNDFWRNKFTDTGAVPAAATIQGLMNTMWYSLVRGADRPKLIICDDDVMGQYEASLQTNQRFTDPKMAELGFEALKYKQAAIVMDGNCTDKTAYFLNTDFLHVRVAENRNFKALPKRSAVDQDAEVVLLAAALNLTMSNAFLQGRLEFTA